MIIFSCFLNLEVTLSPNESVFMCGVVYCVFVVVVVVFTVVFFTEFRDNDSTALIILV